MRPCHHDADAVAAVRTAEQGRLRRHGHSLSRLGRDYEFIHDQLVGDAWLVGRKTKKVYQVGATVEVIVARVDMFKQQVDFKIV